MKGWEWFESSAVKYRREDVLKQLIISAMRRSTLVLAAIDTDGNQQASRLKGTGLARHT